MMTQPAMETRPRLQRYQFSLAALFRLTTIIAILLAVSRAVGPGVFVAALAVLVALGCALAPLLLLVLLSSLTTLSERSVLRIVAITMAASFALGVALDVATALLGEVPGVTVFIAILWVPQGVIIGWSIHAVRADRAERKLHTKTLPPTLEFDDLTDRF
jgi:hypothetical protein